MADQDVYSATVRFVAGLGHDVVRVADLGLSRAADSELLRVAQDAGCIFITRDRDYGRLVFVDASGAGVIYLRASPSSLDAVHAELERVLSIYSQSELASSFLVVEPGRHRHRRPTP